MKNKSNFLTRLITGFCLMIIIVPAVYFGGIFYLILTSILSYIATFELLNMFYTKKTNLKTMRYILPIFSSLTILSFYFAIINKNGFIAFVPSLNIANIIDTTIPNIIGTNAIKPFLFIIAK